ncbi:MAG: right-handed parallel beta-helix repeat-containing protein [Puniceicoccales bacterium]
MFDFFAFSYRRVMVLLVLAVCTGSIPLLGSAEVPRILVSDYGAVINDGGNDRDAFLQAFEECKKYPASVLVLEKGVYDSDRSEEEPLGSISFFLTDLQNLTIEGNGAELTVRTWHPLFRIHDSPNLHVKDLIIDCHPIPHTAGKVIERNPESRTFVLELAEAYRPGIAEKVDLIVGYDAEKKIPNQVPTSRNFLFAQNAAPLTEPIGEDKLRVVLSDKPRTVTPYAAQVVVPELGEWVAMRYKSRVSTTFLFQKCDNLFVENVSIYSAPGMGVNVKHSDGITLKRLRVEPRPREDRWMSTTVDATHFTSCRGRIVIEDCVFEGQEDDGSNVHNMYLRVHEQLSPRVVKLRGGRGYDRFQPMEEPRLGDWLEFGSEEKPYLAMVEAKIVAIESVPTRKDGKAEVYTVTLDRDLPELSVGTVVGNASSIPTEFIMRRSIMRGNRGMGIRVQTRNVLIEDCLFEDILGAGIWIACAAEEANNAAEGVSNRGVVLRNNRIVRTGAMFGPKNPLNGGITMIVGHNKSFLHPFTHQNIRIENNVIEDSFGYGISVVAADQVEVIDNTIVNSTDAPIFIGASKNVLLMGNRYTGESFIEYGPVNEMDSIQVLDNHRLDTAEEDSP